MDHDATEFVISERDFQLKRLEEIRTALADARETGNWTQVPADVYREYLSKVILTASSTVIKSPVIAEIDFVSAETVFITEMPDFGDNGRLEKIVEQDFQNAKQKVMQLLRAQALRCNAEAITDVKLKHTLIDSQDRKKRFLIVATGTAVHLKSG
jgi:uncharacterized protein YbjQ (UPF0145 family)